MFIHVCTCTNIGTQTYNTHTHTNVNFKTGKPADTSRCYKLAENSEQREESPGKEERTKAASRVHRQDGRLTSTGGQWTADGRANRLETSDPDRMSKGSTFLFLHCGTSKAVSAK